MITSRFFDAIQVSLVNSQQESKLDPVSWDGVRQSHVIIFTQNAFF